MGTTIPPSSLVRVPRKAFRREFPGGPVVRTPALSLPRAQEAAGVAKKKSIQEPPFRLNSLSYEFGFLSCLLTYLPTLLCLPVLPPFEMGAHMDPQSLDKIIFHAQIIFFWGGGAAGAALWGMRDLSPLQRKRGVLTTGLPGKSLLSPSYLHPKVKTFQLLKMQKEIFR